MPLFFHKNPITAKNTLDIVEEMKSLLNVFIEKSTQKKEQRFAKLINRETAFRKAERILDDMGLEAFAMTIKRHEVTLRKKTSIVLTRKRNYDRSYAKSAIAQMLLEFLSPDKFENETEAASNLYIMLKLAKDTCRDNNIDTNSDLTRIINGAKSRLRENYSKEQLHAAYEKQQRRVSTSSCESMSRSLL